MSLLNRTIQPDFLPIDNVKYIKADKTILGNDIPMYKVFSNKNDVLKIDLIFPAGFWYQPQTLVATFTSILLLDGTISLSSKEISERLDFLGSYIYPYVEKDIAGITVYCLNKHLEDTLKILNNILSEPSFPQSDLNIHIDNKRQKFFINEGKVKVQSLKVFNEMLFGKEHPYGRNVIAEDYDLINRDLITNFYKRQYHISKCIIIASGKIDKISEDIIGKYLGSFSDNNIVPDDNYDFPIITTSDTVGKFVKKDSVQNSIRIGKVMFNKLHDDYTGMQVLNLVFGGYFGSRLMKNIREDKGYTYGIGSSLISMQKAGVFMIATEAGSEFTDRIIEEVRNEIEEIRKNIVPENELQRAKNYFMGRIVRGFDGSFEMGESFKSILLYGLDYNYFDEFIKKVNSIEAKEINSLANKYLDFDSFKIAIAGKE